MTFPPNACGATFHSCHCILEPHPPDVPHQCVPDPTCGGSWLRHPDDDPGMVRVYAYPSGRPGCDMYDELRADLAADGIDWPEIPDDPGYVLEPDDIVRAPRGGITYPMPPSLADIMLGGVPSALPAPPRPVYDLSLWARAREQELLDKMREPDA
jgi:hypothetical protein